MLKLVGKRIGSCVRDRDIVARFVGDEFAILQIAGSAPTDAMMLARLILDAQGYVFSRPRPPIEIAVMFALRLDGYGDEGAARQIGVRAVAG